VVAVSGGTCSRAEDVWCKLMNLRTVLVGNDVSACGSGIGSDYDAVLEDDAANGGTSLCELLLAGKIRV
jgi:hypothetical protein